MKRQNTIEKMDRNVRFGPNITKTYIKSCKSRENRTETSIQKKSAIQ